jgi:hypothetical protein
MFNYEIIALLSAIGVALVEVVKRVGVQGRWLPIIAIVIGWIFAIVAGGTLFQIFFGGLIIGLTSVGLWEVGRHSILGK